MIPIFKKCGNGNWLLQLIKKIKGERKGDGDREEERPKLVINILGKTN